MPADDYRQVGELPAHGVGPHEVVLMPDGSTLAVANGGIRTHPDARPGAKLNLDSMQPSLDLSRDRQRPAGAAPCSRRRSCTSSASAMPPSMRRGLVAVAMQYEGSKRDRVPLVGLHDGAALRLLEAPETIQRRMRHYTGAIAFDPSGELLAVSSPRGNLFTFWDAAAGTLIDHLTVFDGCGLSAAEAPGAFLVTGGGGEVIRDRAADPCPAVADGHRRRRHAVGQSRPCGHTIDDLEHQKNHRTITNIKFSDR